jgi:gamma-glutamylcyclotransferase (GGCT)/AIG2-like uncharacterized protein YtfP
VTQPNSIFVYGTLKRGQVREKWWPRKPLTVEPATVRGALYDLEKYPALVEGSDLVAGELWHFAAEDMLATLATLDEIEGCAGLADDEYRRVEIVCQTANGAVPAWTYMYAQAGFRPSQRVQTDAIGLCRWPKTAEY